MTTVHTIDPPLNIARSGHVLFREEILAAEVVPQGANKLRDRDRVGVVPDQTKDKDTVLLEVLLDELNRLFLVGVARKLVHQLQVLFDVAVTVDAERCAQDPSEQGDSGDEGDKNHPEPDEEVDLLVEEVDREHALDGVALDVAEATDFEVAHGDAREPRRRGPVVAFDDGPDDVDSVEVEVVAEECIENEELSDDVDEG